MPRRKTFRVDVGTPHPQDPAILKDLNSWAYRLLEDDGAKLHKDVRWGFYPTIGLSGRGLTRRKQLYAAVVCHVIMASVSEHRVAPSYAAVARALNEAELWTYEGNRWTRQTVYQLMRRRNLHKALGKYRHANNLAFMLADTNNKGHIKYW